ncbi:Multidrug resistance-associated protein lethal(2)03659 [Caligus rogercresseyi]|uniref:Multidrug resistance-associated protein lethal(2)03659 n=1 Tax=Caligus rogercresseyi TaxID=217165 RepID=A0A7T8JXF3_CALRO|nr:Multidrug resistance-associated protein lethal(2)03659 [Caligus rogercresseyi]
MKFCKDTFWDTAQIWETPDPEFTDCFFSTIISLLPCYILFIFSPLELISARKKITHTLLDAFSIFKTAIPIILACLLIAEAIFIEDFVVLSDFFRFIVLLLSYGFSLFLHVDGVIRRGTKSSTVQFFYYFTLFVTYGLNIRRQLHLHEDVWVICLKAGCALVATVLYSISETTLRKQKSSKENPKTRQGYKKPIVEADLWDLNQNVTCKNTSSRLDQFYFNSSNQKAFGSQFLIASFIKLGCDCLGMLLPQIMKLMIHHADDPFEMKERAWKGYMYPILLFAASFGKSVLMAQYFDRSEALSLLLFIESVSSFQIILAKIGVWARLSNAFHYPDMVFPPPDIDQCGFMYNELGWAIIGGIAVLILTIPINVVLSYMGKKFQMQQMKAKDKRTKNLMKSWVVFESLNFTLGSHPTYKKSNNFVGTRLASSKNLPG